MEEFVGFYVKDIAFRSVVVPAQTPLRMSLAAALAGVVPPDPTEPFTYCDLCCGDGTTLNALASLNPRSRFYGVDFNPHHISQARREAEELGLKNVVYIESSVADIRPEDFPPFDYITINGAYSWLEDPVREAVLRFASATLKKNGLLYIEYMALPGKVSVAPLWKLIQRLVPPDKYPSKERGREGLKLLRMLARRGMFYLAANPPAARAAHFYLSQSQRDEYFIDHFIHNALASGFKPEHFYEMYDNIRRHGLDFVGSVDPALNDIELSVPPPQVPTFFEITDTALAETVKDFIRNTQDRQDLFSKEPERDPEKAYEAMKKWLWLVTTAPRTEIRKVLTIIGGHKIPLNGPIYDAFLDACASSDQAVPLRALNLDPFPLKQIFKALTRLLATEDFTAALGPSQTPTSIEASCTLRHPVNERLLKKSLDFLGGCVLVSDLTGGAAVNISALEALFLDELLKKGLPGLEDALFDRISRIDKPLPTPRGLLSGSQIKKEELEKMLQAFKKRRLPGFLKLGVLDGAK